MKKFLSLLFIAAGFTFSANAQKIVSYQGEVNFGVATGNRINIEYIGKLQSNLSRPYIETVHGMKITKYAFIGAGLGCQYFCGMALKSVADDKWDTMSIPLFVNMKGMYTIKDEITPFISLQDKVEIYNSDYKCIIARI